MDIRLSLSLHYIALATSIWPALHSVFPHHPTGKMLPPGPWPLATPLWPVVPSHLTHCKGAGQYLDEIRGQLGLDSDLVQQGFAKLFPPLLLLLLFLYLPGLSSWSSLFLPADPDSFSFPKLFSPFPYPNDVLPLSSQCFRSCCTYISLKPT